MRDQNDRNKETEHLANSLTLHGPHITGCVRFQAAAMLSYTHKDSDEIIDIFFNEDLIKNLSYSIIDNIIRTDVINIPTVNNTIPGMKEALEMVLLHIERKEYLAAVRKLKYSTGMGLKQSKEFVDLLRGK